MPGDLCIAPGINSMSPNSIVLYLMGLSLLPNAPRPFKIYCAPPNLGITRTWICRLHFGQKPIFQAWGSLMNLKSQTRDPQLKVPNGGLVLRIFTTWKNPSASVGFEPANLGSRGENVAPRPLRPTCPLIISRQTWLTRQAGQVNFG